MPTYLGSDQTQLHYDDLPATGAGSISPLITLSGGAARHPAYLGDLAGLGAEHHLVIPHLRGVGNSPAPTEIEAGSFWRQAADIERLRVHLDLDRVHLVGHSAGTRLAISYAAQFPDHVAAMVLITPPATYLVNEPTDSDTIIARRHGEPIFDAAIAAGKTAGEFANDDEFNAWHRQVAPTAYAAWTPTEQAHAADAHFSLAAAKAFFSVDPPADLAARLAHVTAPVLVIAGAEDCVTGLAPVVALAKLFPAGQLAVIEQCGHYPWIEQPQAFRAATDPFLAALP